MAGAQTHPLLRFLRGIAASPPPGEDPDRQLLQRFVTEADEGAFEALVRRHGPLVFGLCRRVLGNEADAEDAFQATFLVLVRKAGSLRAPERLGPWLYGVAYRTALKAKACASKRRSLEKPLADMAYPAVTDDPAWAELRLVLDEEVSRLPHKYREPFVLCYLEGLTNEQAARVLGCPPGTVFSRLAWARERLRGVLRRRGLAVAAGVLATALHSGQARAAVPMPLVASTSDAAMAFAAGTAAAAGRIPAQAAALAEGVLRAMFKTKLKLTAAVLLAVGLVGATSGVLARLSPAEGGARAADKDADKARTDKDRLQGTWVAVAVEDAGKKIPEDEVKDRGAEVVFAREKVTLPIKGEAREMGYTLDPAKKPKQIDLAIEEGKTVKGIYLLDGDTLKLCLEREPGGERPTRFGPTEGTTHFLLVLKKK
jgi:RNA polymerase sigma factor (sigma-70 family)